MNLTRKHVANGNYHQLDELVKKRESEKESAQGELDDLLMVFSDTEERLNKYKEKLKALGEAISDDEEGDDDDDDDDDDEEEDEAEEEKDGKNDEDSEVD